MPRKPKRWSPTDAPLSKRNSGGSRAGGGLLALITGADKLATVAPETEGALPTYQAKHPFLDALLNRGKTGAMATSANIAGLQQQDQQRAQLAQALALARLNSNLSLDRSIIEEDYKNRNAVAKAKADQENALALEDRRTANRLQEDEKKAAAEKQAAADKLEQELALRGQAGYVARQGPAKIYQNPQYSNREMALLQKYGEDIGKGATGVTTGLKQEIEAGALSKNRPLAEGDILDKLTASRSTSQLANLKNLGEMGAIQSNPEMARRAFAGKLMNEGALMQGRGYDNADIVGRKFSIVSPPYNADEVIPVGAPGNEEGFGPITASRHYPASLNSFQAPGIAITPEKKAAVTQGASTTAPAGTEQPAVNPLIQAQKEDEDEKLRRIMVYGRSLANILGQ